MLASLKWLICNFTHLHPRKVLKTFQDSHTLLIAAIIILTNSFNFFLQCDLKGGPRSKVKRKWHSLLYWGWKRNDSQSSCSTLKFKYEKATTSNHVRVFVKSVPTFCLYVIKIRHAPIRRNIKVKRIGAI